MFLLRYIIDKLYDAYRWFHAVARTVYDLNLPIVDKLLHWCADRIENLADAFRQLSDEFEDIQEWFELVHDIALRVIDVLDVEEWLKDVLDLAGMSLGFLTLRLLDAFRFAFTASSDLADAFVDALKPALERAFDFLSMTGVAFSWAVLHIINEVFKPGVQFFDNIIDTVWDSISSVGGPLLDWLIDNADWIRDNLLNIPTWLAYHIAANARDFIELVLDLPSWLLEQIEEGAEWTQGFVTDALNALLDIIVNKTVDFVTAVASGVSSHLDDVAQPIIDLGELILDYVWGEETG